MMANNDLVLVSDHTHKIQSIIGFQRRHDNKMLAYFRNPDIFRFIIWNYILINIISEIQKFQSSITPGNINSHHYSENYQATLKISVSEGTINLISSFQLFSWYFRKFLAKRFYLKHTQSSYQLYQSYQNLEYPHLDKLAELYPLFFHFQYFLEPNLFHSHQERQPFDNIMIITSKAYKMFI